MGAFLELSQSEAETMVRGMRGQPDHNYIIAYQKMSTKAKWAVNILVKYPALLEGVIEKASLLVFQPDKIIVQRTKKDSEPTVIPAAAVSDFKVHDGVNNSFIIEFTANGQAYSLFAKKGSNARLQYVADNLKALIDNHFVGYAK